MPYSTETEPNRETADNADWFAQNAPPQASATAPYIPPTGPNGTYTYDDVQKINQTVFGGALKDVTPWVGQKDAFQNLLREPQAQNYLNSKQATTPAGSGGGGSFDFNNPDTWTKENLNAYAKSRGVDDPNFADYWLGKKDELFARGQQLGQPDYAFKRLQAADQFVGGPQNSPYAGSGNGAPTDYLAPFTEQFSYQPWNAPAPFQAPTGANEQNDPGFNFRLQQGQDALARSAAAKGTLLTGTQVQDLQNYAQNFASNEYGNVYNRAASEYDRNLANSYQGWMTNYQKALGEYNNRKATFYANQDNPFSKLLAQETLESNNQNQLNNLGLGYASLYANTLGNGSNAATNYLTQGANANAAGSVGAANAFAGLPGQIGNSALTAYYLSQYGRGGGRTIYD